MKIKLRFKIGDRVRKIRPSHMGFNDIPVGSVGVIVKIEGDNDFNYRVKYDGLYEAYGIDSCLELETKKISLSKLMLKK